MKLYESNSKQTAKGEKTYLSHSKKVDYVCYCEACGGVGTRNQYGRDWNCPDCGEPLDWSKEEEW